MNNLIELKIKNIEKKIGLKLDTNSTTLGLDTASKTGYCIAKTYKKELFLSIGFINIKSKNRYFKYNQIIKHLYDLIRPEYKIIIEDTFFSRNAWMFKMITFVGAIAYTIARLKKCENIHIILANQARKKLRIKGNTKKKDLVKIVNKLLGVQIKNNDICDAIILALGGLIKEEKLEV